MGHGHVIPNPGGALARCGGPNLGCEVCLAEQRSLEAPAKVQGSPFQKPSCGRIVHYQDPKLGVCAAIVASVVPGREDEGTAVLFVIHPNPLEASPLITEVRSTNHVAADYSPKPEIGHWSWPPRT